MFEGCRNIPGDVPGCPRMCEDVSPTRGRHGPIAGQMVKMVGDGRRMYEHPGGCGQMVRHP